MLASQENFMRITSRNNEKIKAFVKLRDSARARNTEGLFVLEGARLCFDALESGYNVQELFYTETALSRYAERVTALIENSVAAFEAADEVAQKLADTVNSQGVFCTVKMKETAEICPSSPKKYVALDGIQNPDNLGAISRTAEALGVDALIVGGGCDIYNPKALRASMGALLRLPVISVPSILPVLQKARENGLPVLSTVPDSTAEDITTVDFSRGAVTVIGNEGNGVSKEVKAFSDRFITIPMGGKAESLNASAAATITMWEMMK